MARLGIKLVENVKFATKIAKLVLGSFLFNAIFVEIIGFFKWECVWRNVEINTFK